MAPSSPPFGGRLEASSPIAGASGPSGAMLCISSVVPGFKNKTRYTPYVSPGSQISHIATNKGNIKVQMLNI